MVRALERANCRSKNQPPLKEELNLESNFRRSLYYLSKICWYLHQDHYCTGLSPQLAPSNFFLRTRLVLRSTLCPFECPDHMDLSTVCTQIQSTNNPLKNQNVGPFTKNIYEVHIEPLKRLSLGKAFLRDSKLYL